MLFFFSSQHSAQKRNTKSDLKVHVNSPKVEGPKRYQHKLKERRKKLKETSWPRQNNEPITAVTAKEACTHNAIPLFSQGKSYTAVLLAHGS